MKKILSFILILILILPIFGCKKDATVYADIPDVSETQKGTTEYVAAKLNKKYKSTEYTTMHADLIGATDGHTVCIDGVRLEIYKYDTDTDVYLEAKEKGTFTIYDENKTPLKTVEAYANGRFVLIVPSRIGQNGVESKKVDKYIKAFQRLKL